jgi:large subunit ribosomal protein L25
MDVVEITVERRIGGGKGFSRRLRQGGTIPAIFYGPKRASVSITVHAREFGEKLANLEGSHLIKLLHPTSDTELHEKMVLLREVQRHPVSGAVLHADFYEVDLTRRLAVSVPLHFVGKAAGVVAGGILQPILRELQVECLPTEIPDFLSVDVSNIGIHEAVHVSDLQLPEGVKALGDAGRAIVTVLPPTVEEAKVAAEGAEVAPVEGAPGEPGAAAAPAEAPAGAGKKGGEA